MRAIAADMLEIVDYGNGVAFLLCIHRRRLTRGASANNNYVVMVLTFHSIAYLSPYRRVASTVLTALF